MTTDQLASLPPYPESVPFEQKQVPSPSWTLSISPLQRGLYRATVCAYWGNTSKHRIWRMIELPASELPALLAMPMPELRDHILTKGFERETLLTKAPAPRGEGLVLTLEDLFGAKASI